MGRHERPLPRRPDRGKRAHSFGLFRCSDPKCGVHIISYNGDGEAICETVITDEVMRLAIDLNYRGEHDD